MTVLLYLPMSHLPLHFLTCVGLPCKVPFMDPMRFVVTHFWTPCLLENWQKQMKKIFFRNPVWAVFCSLYPSPLLPKSSGFLRLIRSLHNAKFIPFFIRSSRLKKSLRICIKKNDFAVVAIFCSNLSSDSDSVLYDIWPSYVYSVTHDMLKNWCTPLLGHRDHCS